MMSEVNERLDRAFRNWQIEESGGEFRYQATPRSSIIGFFGYANSYDEAVERLLLKEFV
jgi:hypothetical protein